MKFLKKTKVVPLGLIAKERSVSFVNFRESNVERNNISQNFISKGTTLENHVVLMSLLTERKK